MGSFAGTCCISGLPIEAGDAVRYFLLTQNPYCTGGFVCESHGRWVPRTWPIRAKYNDYGSIEGWETGPVQALIMRGLQADLIEVGVGNNSIHDVAVKKDMPFEDLLNAVWEGRVMVKRNALDEECVEKIIPTPETPKWVPTLHNVEAVLSEVQLPGQGRYLVDEQKDRVRVRWDGLSGDYGKDEERLLTAKSVLEQTFAVVLTAGGGSYPNSVELLCFMAHGKDEQGHARRIYVAEEKPTLLIQQAMIREDVWQALLGLKITDPYKGYSSCSIDDYQRSVLSFFSKLQALKKQLAESSRGTRKTLADWEIERAGRGEWGAAFLAKETIPFAVGLSYHANLLIEDGHADEAFAALAAEFSFIWRLLSDVRYVWRPSDVAGPQCGEYKAHTAFLRAMTKACLEAKKRRGT